MGIGIGRQLFELFFENHLQRKTTKQLCELWSLFPISDWIVGMVPFLGLGTGTGDWGLGSNLNSPKDQMESRESNPPCLPLLGLLFGRK